MKSLIVWLSSLMTVLILTPLLADTAPIPRKVVALYDSNSYLDLWFTRALQYVAMPTEHAGLIVDYCDIQDGFPDIKEDPSVIGVVIWDLRDIKSEIAEKYVRWLLEVMDGGKKIVMFNSFPPDSLDPDREMEEAISRFWKKMGLEVVDWESQTYSTEIVYEDPKLMNFERNYIGVMSPYPMMEIVSNAVTSHLTVKNLRLPNKEFTLVATGPHGSYVAEDYGLYKQYYDDRDYIKWFFNPFSFFRLAFNTDALPKPDTTTMAGRRIYYSQIDGDGWNSISDVEKYRKSKSLSSEVILQEIIAPHPDLPVTVAPIGGDLDLTWVGVPQSIEIAKDIFELDHVEIGSHTYSHPFEWGFFQNYKPQDEEPYFDKYQYGTWEDTTLLDEFKSFVEKKDGEEVKIRESEFRYPKKLSQGYVIPRAYANKPFSIELEIQGSINFINKIAPAGKKVAILQWSGDCAPFAKALKLTSEARVGNINGGDTIFDRNYSSYAWVRPLSRTTKGERQIYSSMSNENLYTNLWTEKFYGFKQLLQTFENTNIPIRVKPLNLYYHMYSGEKLASLRALQQNIEFIKKQEIIPIKTSEFVKIVEGFYSTQIYPAGEMAWKIVGRGKLQTIRFDKAVLRGIDFEKSKGVIGQRHLHGSLYVYLDEKVEEPLIALKEIEDYFHEPLSALPYLVSSRWSVDGLERQNESHWSFIVRGYGNGEMTWRVPSDGEYRIKFDDREMIVSSNDKHLHFTIVSSALEPKTIDIEKKGS